MVAKYPDNVGLSREAYALSRVVSSYVPKVVFYDGKKLPLDTLWIIESRVKGLPTGALSHRKLAQLG